MKTLLLAVLGLICLETSFAYEVEKDIVYDTIDNIPLKLDLFRPSQKTTSAPSVVFLHGGCFNAGSKNDIPNEVKALADEGFVVFSVGYRLSTVAKYPAAVTDIQQAVRFIRKNAGRFGIDAHKIIGHGLSAGGYLAAILGVRPMPDRSGNIDSFSDRVDLVVDWYGRTDFTLSQSQGFDCAVDFLGFPRTPETRKKFEEASILPYVDRHSADFYIVHGTADQQVFPVHSELLFTKLKKQHAKVHILRMLGAGHAFTGGTAWKRTKDFLMSYR